MVAHFFELLIMGIIMNYDKLSKKSFQCELFCTHAHVCACVCVCLCVCLLHLSSYIHLSCKIKLLNDMKAQHLNNLFIYCP